MEKTSKKKSFRGLVDLLYPELLLKLNIVESFEIPSLKKEQLINYQESMYINNFPGLLWEYPIGNERIAITNKRKPHAYFDLMIMESNLNNKASIIDLEIESAKNILEKSYKYVEFISKLENINKFNLEHGHLHLVYNFNHLPDRSSAMSIGKFHLHMNYWTGKQLSQLKIDKLAKSTKQIDLVDATILLAGEIIDYEMDFSNFKFIEKINFSIEDMLNNSNPLGLELRLKQGWKTVKSVEFIKLLRYIHNRLMSLDLKYYSLFTGESSYPEKWTRGYLLNPEDFYKKLSIMKLPNRIEGKLKKFYSILRDVSPDHIKKMRKKEKLLNKYIIISALNYSISIYSTERNKSKKPIINSDDVRVLIQVKKFSPSGGAGQTFLPGLASLINIEREKSFMSKEDLKKREEFQNMYLEYINPYQ